MAYTLSDWLHVVFHAADGGIQAGHDAYRIAKGLYACGEAAGGIHGADRLSGMASKPFVFCTGLIAPVPASRCGMLRCDQAYRAQMAIYVSPGRLSMMVPRTLHHAIILFPTTFVGLFEA